MSEIEFLPAEGGDNEEPLRINTDSSSVNNVEAAERTLRNAEDGINEYHQVAGMSEVFNRTAEAMNAQREHDKAVYARNMRKMGFTDVQIQKALDINPNDDAIGMAA